MIFELQMTPFIPSLNVPRQDTSKAFPVTVALCGLPAFGLPVKGPSISGEVIFLQKKKKSRLVWPLRPSLETGNRGWMTLLMLP